MSNIFSLDIVVSSKNYDYVKNFKSFNKIYIYENNLLNFFLKNKIIFKKYDYILIHDGKRRSTLISFLIFGKKISLIKFSKSLFFYKFLKFFNFNTYFNSENFKLLDNLNFLNLLIGNKNSNIQNNFYFDYTFDDSFQIDNKKYCILHLDEKWFKDYYYPDFTYPVWSNKFFYKIIETIKSKFNLPVIITTGSVKVKFINQLIEDHFYKSNENVYHHKEKHEKLILLNNLSFRQIEFVLKENCEILISCEGGVTHISHNLNIKTFAFVEPKRDNFYNHWTGHMKKITLCNRSNNIGILETLNKL